MYFMLECLSPAKGYIAAVEHRDDDPMRCWNCAERFEKPPPVPLRPRLRMRRDSVLAEMWKAPLPLMTQRLHQALLACGVANLDVYSAVLLDPRSGQEYTNYVAFNLIGAVAAADLRESKHSAPDGPMISVDFDSLVIDENRTRGALMFRLAEAVNGIVVHESVKQGIEASGIDTLTFIPPEKWAG